MWILTNVSQDTDGKVYAGQPTVFDKEEESIDSAKEQLADDFGLTVDEVVELADVDITRTPYVFSMSRDGRFEAYIVSEMPDAKSIKVETPKGTIIAEAKGAKDDFPGIWIFEDDNKPFNMLAAVEYNTPDTRIQIEGYQSGTDEPRVIIDYETGDDLL